MKASELRMGNLIQNNKGNNFFVNPNHLIVMMMDVNHNYNPIPLTEEWLLKFGFEWKGNKFLTIFTPCGKALVYIGDNFFKFSGITIEIQIKYVHQLQNLYFALTGEELILK